MSSELFQKRVYVFKETEETIQKRTSFAQTRKKICKPKDIKVETFNSRGVQSINTQKLLFGVPRTCKPKLSMPYFPKGCQPLPRDSVGSLVVSGSGA